MKWWINTENQLEMQLPILKKYIHYDTEMEAAILGAFLLVKFSFARVRGIITEECFYSEGHKIIFNAISEMWANNVGIDILTLTQFLVRNKNISDIDGNNVPYYVSKLTTSVVSTANLEQHSLLVRQLYAERELFKMKYTPQDETGDVLVRARNIQNELNKIMQIKVTDDWKDMVDVVIDLHNHMDLVKDKDLIGVPTGFSRLDLVTGGLVKGSVTVVAARPSVGKSALLNAMSIYPAKLGYKVGIISLEMPNVQIGARMGSLVSDVEFYKIFRNRMDDEMQREKLYADLEMLANLPIKISDKTGVNVGDIRAKVSQLASKGDIDILFIDYLQLVDGETSNRNYNREQEVSKLSRGIKIMAMDFQIPIVVLAQLNRESEKLSNKKPAIHHLRESGSIEQDADGVILLHRDWKSGITANADGSSTEFEADLIVAKWRNGETPEIKIGYDPPKMRFYDLDAMPKFRQPQQNWKPITNNTQGSFDEGFNEQPF